MGPERICHSSHHFATQRSHSVDRVGDEPKWLPLNFGYHYIMRMGPTGSVWTCAKAQNNGWNASTIKFKGEMGRRRNAFQFNGRAVEVRGRWVMSKLWLWRRRWQDWPFVPWGASGDSPACNRTRHDTHRQTQTNKVPKQAKQKHITTHNSKNSDKNTHTDRTGRQEEKMRDMEEEWMYDQSKKKKAHHLKTV